MISKYEKKSFTNLLRKLQVSKLMTSLYITSIINQDFVFIWKPLRNDLKENVSKNVGVFRKLPDGGPIKWIWQIQ